MADDTTPTPKNIKLVETPPESIFDNIEALRKTAVLTVARKKPVLVNVPVKKPSKDAYFRVHPSPDWSLDASVIVADDDRDDFYFVTPFMLQHHTMLPRLRKVTLATVYSWPGGALSLWPVPIIGEETRINCWRSARSAYDLAKKGWVQLVWNPETRDYDVVPAEGNLPEPVWPTDKTFQDLLRLGFADRIIASPEHPYVMRLRGLAE